MPLLPSARKTLKKFIFHQNNVQALSRRLLSSQLATANAKNSKETRVTRLANGLRIATESTGSPTSTVGIFLDVGSRNEYSDNNGCAHFLERLAYKGTANCNRLSLEQEVEGLGAQLQSSVSRTVTSYYANCLSKDVPKMASILADVVTDHSISDSNVEEQRGVILKELDDIEKNEHKTVVLDYLHATAYQGTPLSLTVQGPTETISSVSREDLIDFKKLHYTPSRMILAASGGIDHDKLVEQAAQLFSSTTTEKSVEPSFPTPCRFTGSELRHRHDDAPFPHVAMAIEGVGLNHEDFLPLLVANQIIGSWDRTAVNAGHFPNPLVRHMHKDGLCQSFQAFNVTYSDTSLWGIHFVSTKEDLFDCTVGIQNEWMRLCTNLNEFEVSRAKNLLLTNLAQQLESTTASCKDIAWQIFTRGHRLSFDETAKNIMNVRHGDVKRATNHYIWDTCPAVGGYGPVEGLPDYGNIRGKMYKIWH